MAKRKARQIEDVEENLQDAGREELLFKRGSEDQESEEEASSGSELSGSGAEQEQEDEDEDGNEGEEDLNAELDELHEELSSSEDVDGSEDDDEEDPSDRDESPGAQVDAEDPASTAFGRAFGKIMKKRFPQSELTEISGPVLADRKQLLVQKLEEAEAEGKANKTSGEEKREAREKGHVLPQTYTDAKEKALIKLATKGVVRLFNAVSKAQKVQADADTSSRTAARATLRESKAAFMTELKATAKGESNKHVGPIDETPAQREERNGGEPGWAALRSNFMLGSSAKLADWDKNLGQD